MRTDSTTSTFRLLQGLLLLAAGLPVTGWSAPVTLCGPTICYEYDNAQSSIALFGTPSLLGGSDTLQFTPDKFDADTDPANDADPVNPIPWMQTAVFNFSRVYSTNGGEIASIVVTESGYYQILNNGTVNVNLRLQSVDQVNDGSWPGGVPEVTVGQFNWDTSVPTGLSLDEWTLAGTLTPAATFNDAATVVNLQIQNTLQALTSGGYAFIAKKLTLTTTTTVVPVPAAVWLFGSAVGLLGWLRRRAIQPA